ncbi:hypothetical protein [Actinomadura harenae]|uniref:Uncharacterized protein n=1 Tax=Actinomadura harenae TaxID=2483351 RepID=A0A3M2MBT3_9ACTN|nr:hypothetical protein [Actinomadura harenae]RMI46989.1 hypothetical protein EBO15_05055 [Actinomadura harenae]
MTTVLVTGGVVIRCVCPRQVDTPGFRAAAAAGPSATGRMRGVPPGRVLDAVDRSLARRPARDLYVFPDPLTRAVARARRWLPGPTARPVGRITASR